jgi:hypothetical protein
MRMASVSNFFSRSKFQKYYKLKNLEEQLNIYFVVKFYEFHDTNQLMASWWKEDKKFTKWSNGWYGTTTLREPYIYFMDLFCRLYVEKECSKFSKAWIPLVYIVAMLGCSFNWGEIISNKLGTSVVQAQMLKEGEAPWFHMASYLLDVICARNVIVGMNLS